MQRLGVLSATLTSLHRFNIKSGLFYYLLYPEKRLLRHPPGGEGIALI